MEDGVSLYQDLFDAIDSNDLKQIAAFVRTLEKKCLQENVSFYALDALACELQKYINRLESSDPRGLKGKGKGINKNDVLATCKQVLKIINTRKIDLKEKEMAWRPDYSELFRDFLPREFTRNLDIPPCPKIKQKVRR